MKSNTDCISRDEEWAVNSKYIAAFLGICLIFILIILANHYWVLNGVTKAERQWERVPGKIVGRELVFRRSKGYVRADVVFQYNGQKLTAKIDKVPEDLAKLELGDLVNIAVNPANPRHVVFDPAVMIPYLQDEIGYILSWIRIVIGIIVFMILCGLVAKRRGRNRLKCKVEKN